MDHEWRFIENLYSESYTRTTYYNRFYDLIKKKRKEYQNKIIKYLKGNFVHVLVLSDPRSEHKTLNLSFVKTSHEFRVLYCCYTSGFFST